MTFDPEYHCKLTREEINTLPLATYDGPIKLIQNPHDAVVAVNDLRKYKILGFDTEKRPSFKKGQFYNPSLLQLAHQKAAFIFQLKTTGMPKELLKLLANKRIVKAGVAVRRDVQELQEVKSFEPAGFIDLGDKAREANLKHHGLRGLAALLLNVRISKSAKLTNWSKKNLPEKAVKYAATDAWLGLKLYQKMRELGFIN